MRGWTREASVGLLCDGDVEIDFDSGDNVDDDDDFEVRMWWMELDNMENEVYVLLRF